MRIGNRGQVLLVFLGALLALLGVAALGIDAGYLYTVRHELQRSTDAGALAGASAFFDGSWSDAAIRALADARGRAYASKDKVAAAALSSGGEISVAFPTAERVRVDASRNVPLFFSRIFLGPTKTVTAYSVAEASAAGTNVKGMKPWGIPYPWEDKNGNGLFDPGEKVHKECDPLYDPSNQFCPGTRIILKIGTPKNSPKNPSGIPSLQQESGHFFCLAIDGTGGSLYRDTIENGSNAPVKIGDAVTLEPGDMVGPTRQGTQALMDADPNSTWNAEKNLPESNAYKITPQAGEKPWMHSPRVIRIPIYDPEIALTQGRSEMVIAGFAGFWIESIGHQGTVTGRYVQMPALGEAGPTQGPSSGPVLRVLRLVE
ncbi:MAG: pilus assembly protein TadG-related protein [bacterium]|nr:pilus assembly protein TadG-related protein [bacterium]